MKNKSPEIQLFLSSLSVTSESLVPPAEAELNLREIFCLQRKLAEAFLLQYLLREETSRSHTEHVSLDLHLENIQRE